MARVLLTGMSGTGKSALVGELRRRGYTGYDADGDGLTEPRAHGGWGWRTDRIAALLARSGSELVFLAGCSEEQALFAFDCTVVLTAPESVMFERICVRTGNLYGKRADERERIRADLRTVQPLLLRSADVVIDSTLPLSRVADLVLAEVRQRGL